MTDRDAGKVQRYELESAGFGLGDHMVKRDDGDWHLHEDCAADHDKVVARLESELDERQGERDKLRMVLGLMAGGVGRSLPEEAEHQLDTLRARVSELEEELRALTPPSQSG